MYENPSLTLPVPPCPCRHGVPGDRRRLHRWLLWTADPVEDSHTGPGHTPPSDLAPGGLTVPIHRGKYIFLQFW